MGPVYMSQIAIVDGCGANQGLLVMTCFEKEQNVAGEGGHAEVVQHFPDKILVLVPEDKTQHSTVQVQEREVGMDCQEGSKSPKNPEALQPVSRGKDYAY